MPQFSEDLYLGTAVAGGPGVSAGPSPMTVGVGPLGRSYCFDVVPAASGTTTGQNQICASANLPAGAMVIRTAAVTGVTVGYDAAGANLVILDCARNIAIYSAADLHLQTITVAGYDQYGQAMSETITCPNATTVFGAKCFKSVKSCTSSGAIASAVVVGTGTSIGLPHRVTDLGYISSVMYNQTAIAITSTLVKIGDVTDPATTTTTDVRGMITVGATDNAKRLIVNYALPALAVGPNATRVGAFGIAQV